MKEREEEDSVCNRTDILVRVSLNKDYPEKSFDTLQLPERETLKWGQSHADEISSSFLQEWGFGEKLRGRRAQQGQIGGKACIHNTSSPQGPLFRLNVSIVSFTISVFSQRARHEEPISRFGQGSDATN